MNTQHTYADTDPVHTHNQQACMPTHTIAHAHPWKKTLTLRPHTVHVSPSGIINTMLMNIGLGPGAFQGVTKGN